MKQLVLLAVVALAALALAQQQPKAARYVPETQSAPDPKTMIILRQEDGPYSVPEGSRLVVYAVGSTGNSDDMALTVDGHPLLLSSNDIDGRIAWNERTVRPFPVNDTFVLANGSAGAGIAFGYLVRLR